MGSSQKRNFYVENKNMVFFHIYQISKNQNGKKFAEPVKNDIFYVLQNSKTLWNVINTEQVMSSMSKKKATNICYIDVYLLLPIKNDKVV